MWLAEMSSSRSRGMVIVVATSSGRRLSWRRLPEIRNSVRLACSFRARRRGLRDEGAKLRPHTDTDELPSCASHSRVTRLFSSAERQTHHALYWIIKMCISTLVCICVFSDAHPLPGCDRLSCSAQGEEGDPRRTLQPRPATHNNITPSLSKKSLQ